MKKLIAGFAMLIAISGSAQTLFTYGKEAVSVNEFLRAYQKNNPGIKDAKAFREYLDLYIASKLKIKEARTKRLDTLPQIVSDLASLRQQILPAYINDKSIIRKMAEEAFTRSQKDIRLAHIFIGFKQKTPQDVDAANKKLAEVQSELNKGTAFEKIAAQYSDDPTAKQNNGNLGWITAFTLPYELENLAYKTAAGKMSEVYESKSGYHIFYNIAERKNPGRINAAQILLAFPPGSDDAAKTPLKKLADSLYLQIQKGSDFEKLAAAYSNDVVSAASNGRMPEFGVGEFEPGYEEMVYRLKENEVSPPFATAHGYHIVKLLQKIPAATQSNDSLINVFSERVEQSDRMELAKAEVSKKIMERLHPKEPFSKWDELWALSDSVMAFKPAKRPISITNATPLLEIGKRKYVLNDWYAFATIKRFNPDGTVKPYTKVWEEFKTAKANEYYSEHLEDFNEEFRNQLKEFAEGNLFFEIMQRQVWQAAQKDSVALRKYFDKNSAQFNWKESADAVIFYAPNEAGASHFKSHLGSIAGWRKAAEEHSEMTADSGRFELAYIPNAIKENLKEGTTTAVLVNPSDKSASFAYIIKTYPAGQRRSFAEAKALVINSYQDELEKRWVAQLKKKYTVAINEKAWGELVKNKRW